MSMRIYLAGATGVIGNRLVPLLVDAGHTVGAMTRSAAKAQRLASLGAQPIVCDVFDRSALTNAVRAFSPDLVLHELTDLPDEVTICTMTADKLEAEAAEVGLVPIERLYIDPTEDHVGSTVVVLGEAS